MEEPRREPQRGRTEGANSGPYCRLVRKGRNDAQCNEDSGGRVHNKGGENTRKGRGLRERSEAFADLRGPSARGWAGKGPEFEPDPQRDKGSYH